MPLKCHSKVRWGDSPTSFIIPLKVRGTKGVMNCVGCSLITPLAGTYPKRGNPGMG